MYDSYAEMWHWEAFEGVKPAKTEGLYWAEEAKPVIISVQTIQLEHALLCTALPLVAGFPLGESWLDHFSRKTGGMSWQISNVDELGTRHGNCCQTCKITISQMQVHPKARI